MTYSSFAQRIRPSLPDDAVAGCTDCSLNAVCIPLLLTKVERKLLDVLIGMPLTLGRGQQLYREGDQFKTVYIVKSGYLKTDVNSQDGRSQILGFQMAGELLGTDGINSATHSCNAVALEPSQVCSINFAALEILASEIPRLQQHFFKLLSREIVRGQGIMMLLGTMSASQRLAAFLLNLSQRYAALGYSATDFNLRMSREEIGSYLGLSLETISRVFSRFHDHGVVKVDLKHIQILDILRLRVQLSGVSANQV